MPKSPSTETTEAMAFVANNIPRLLLLYSRITYITQTLAEKNKEWLELKGKDVREFECLSQALTDRGFPLQEFMTALKDYADLEVSTTPRKDRAN